MRSSSSLMRDKGFVVIVINYVTFIDFFLPFQTFIDSLLRNWNQPSPLWHTSCMDPLISALTTNLSRHIMLTLMRETRKACTVKWRPSRNWIPIWRFYWVWVDGITMRPEQRTTSTFFWIRKRARNLYMMHWMSLRSTGLMALIWHGSSRDTRRIRSWVRKFHTFFHIWHTFSLKPSFPDFISCVLGSENDVKTNFASFVRELKGKFEGLLVTVTALPNQKYIEDFYDVPTLQQLVQFIIVSTYDYCTPKDNPSTADFAAPLYTPKNRKQSVDVSISKWHAAGAQDNKLILAIPTFGRSWVLGDNMVSFKSVKVENQEPPFNVSTPVSIYHLQFMSFFVGNWSNPSWKAYRYWRTSSSCRCSWKTRKSRQHPSHGQWCSLARIHELCLPTRSVCPKHEYSGRWFHIVRNARGDDL